MYNSSEQSQHSNIQPNGVQPGDVQPNGYDGNNYGYDRNGEGKTETDRRGQQQGGGSRQRQNNPRFANNQGAAGGRQTLANDFPLRILVYSDMVGAIIGRQGTTIREITQQTRARVDVHRKDNVGSVEKAITIYGNPENCTKACRRILEVMQQEANNTNKREISLKILAHNNLIGRIIGKDGNTIKRIMQDTDTKITVSSIHDITDYNLERIITVKGSIENMSKAEAMISSKLRQSYENDLQAIAPQSVMFPGLHPMAMMSTVGMGFPGFPQLYGGPGGMNTPYARMKVPTPVAAGGANEPQETVYVYIPNSAVGAMIGTKGTHIKNMIRFSGATVKIAPEPDKEKQEADPQQQQKEQSERKITIVGTPEAQWKAQYLIFQKLREECFVPSTEDVRLTIEIVVPSFQVGHIIGKGGQNVRELQRLTGAVIKFPEQPKSTGEESAGEETTVHIFGPFRAVQAAQRQIKAVMQKNLNSIQGQNRGRRQQQGGEPFKPPSEWKRYDAQ